MELLKYNLRAIFGNGRTLFWSLGFSIFLDYVVMFYLSNPGHVINQRSVLIDSAVVYPLVLMFSSSMASVAIGRSFVSQSPSFGYLFRFTRLSSLGYLYQLVLAAALLFGTLSAVFLSATWALGIARFGISAPPRDIPAALGASVVAGLIFAGFSILSASVLLTLRARSNVNFVQFLPVFLYFATYWVVVTAGAHGTAFYASPFLSAGYLMYYAFSGSTVFYVNTAPYNFGLTLSLVSCTVWVLGTLLISGALISRIRLSVEEEERVI